MAVYAIGDVQGCYDELIQLLDIIKFKKDTDQLWFTGDLVNRGPKSLETLRFIRDLGDSAVVVLGNHDLHLLATAFDHRKPGRKDTLDELLDAPDHDELIEWLRYRPLIHIDDDLDVVMVHAGLHPDWTIEKAQSLAHEVESVLRSDKHIGFYQHMYGDKPRKWSEKLYSWPRLRYITNILTRLRYCDENGRSSMNSKGVPGSQPEGLHPWFELKNRRSKDAHILFGHWSTLVLSPEQNYHNVYPLDTGCLWGGKLTAMRIDRRPFETFQLNCPESQKPKAPAASPAKASSA